jgi:hypothetical protein
VARANAFWLSSALASSPWIACLLMSDACVGCIAVVHQHFNGKLKVELRPPAPEEVLVNREKACAFKDWLDGVR